jgi:uncharacterized protein (DUF2164 family)
MAIGIPKKSRERMILSIQRYFTENMDEEIGELKASLLLDFCLREIGPSIYNQAVADAQVFMRDRVSDLEGSCFEPEFGFWKK